MIKLAAPVAVTGMIFFGTVCSLLAKLIYSVEGLNSYGEVVRYEKPWFQVLTMFAGMSVCILLDLPIENRRPKKNELAKSVEEGATLLHASGDQVAEQPSSSKSVWLIGIPTLLDLFGTACGCTGLLYTTVSVYQMLRGAMLVWTALLSVTVLRRCLSLLNYAGIALCFMGIVLVGLANVWSEKSPRSQSDTFIGIVIILAGQILQAAQVVVEEFLLQGLNVSSVRVVAWEGLFGVIHCVLWVFPVVYLIPGRDHGHLENSWDAFYMLFHSWPIFAVIVSDMIMMLFYNVCGMEVTDNLNAVHRVVIETLRTLCVWIVDLFIYYVISDGKLGERWTPYSFLQLLGFMLLILGTIVFNYENLLADFELPKKTATASVTVPGVPVISVDAAVPLKAPLEGGAVQGVQYESITQVADGKAPCPEFVPSVNIRIYDDEEEEEEDEEDDRPSSFYGQIVGSASHGSFLLAGTPTSGSGSLSASPRLWGTHAQQL